MTMLDTLFGLIPAESRGQQWLAEELQLVNWGGYDGPHRVRFSPGATLLSGGSGSGKSTLMDAYIALMMPHTTPFNGASNGAVTGRARGEDQRNILSYGRGKIDESRTEEGTRMTVLRGDDRDIWTAIAMTWVDHTGERFTAVRAWYIPLGARIVEDTVRVRATVEGPFSLEVLEAAAQDRFSTASVRRAGLDPVGTEQEFSARMHAVLGIGAAGAGTKAMRLLARVQSGQQFSTVDEVYKRLVLEDPETLGTADAVVSHFDELESTRTRMVTAQKQVRALRPIRGMRTRIEDAAERLRLLDQVGAFADPGSLAALWRTGRRLELLRDVESELQRQKREADAAVREAQALALATESERDGLAEVLRSSGGDRLDTAERELRGAEDRLSEVRANRDRLAAAAAVLDADLNSAAGFAEALEQARLVLDDPEQKRRVRESFAEARSLRLTRDRELRELEAEREEAEDRQDNIPRALHESRALLAEAAGLSVEELPFVAELIDVRTEFEPWREAFHLALGGFAKTMLIDQANLGRFRQAIDRVRTPIRLNYEGVVTGQELRRALDPEQLPGRLDYREGPFTGWLQDRLEQQFGFRCVDTVSDSSGQHKTLTLSGQVAQGARGGHGGHGRGNLFGFSNQRRLRELGDAIAAAETALRAALTAEEQATLAHDRFDEHSTASARLVETEWSTIDVAAATAERDRWAKVSADIVSGNPKIASLQEQIQRLKRESVALQQAVGRAEGLREDLAARWAEITDQVDAEQAVWEAAEDAGRALTAEQADFLSDHVEEPGASPSGKRTDELTRFNAALDAAAKRLLEEQRRAQAVIEEQRDALRRTFESYLESWPNPNLRADPDSSLADFEQLLDGLEDSGLHELEGEWKESLLKLSGNDLTSLDSALSRALREIRERIEPINRIMRDLPFYDDEHRLQISPRETQSEVRRRFRAELREVRRLIEAADTDQLREQVYPRMAKLINRIRRQAPDFTELIDVRTHVRVSAEKVHADTGAHAALYDHIGEKSGGESQELIAFIVGAALRYQLGDADAERPRYAPVFLDEALIKADAHFTKRAIGAWRGLGFQLVIGAPNDKYSAIEPHVDVEYDILKDTSGRSWARPKVALPAA
ncbi:ATP-binding protein [Leucobacter sp. M11]|uniref:ATP-binding protein n=1 Tax=Leucobacter sp. M11 TaxID=2993565 RepID=UPI002DAC62C5|nr:AAA family ATPase [Leucobacter sp. M11]